MREWEQGLYIYRTDPAPPKMGYQQYIDLYLAEKDETYIAWFLHHYEQTLNTKAKGYVHDYAMYGHFSGIKSALVFALWQALMHYDPEKGLFMPYKEDYLKNAVHEYVRTMRTGFTVQSKGEDEQLRLLMRKFAKRNYKTDDATIAALAKELDWTEKKVREYLQAGCRNMRFTDFYKQYSDEDSEESTEEIGSSPDTEPYRMLNKMQLEEALLSAYEALSYRERAIVAEHLGFCMECFGESYIDEADGRKKPIELQPFIDIAYNHTLSSPATADRIYRQALSKMRTHMINLLENKNEADD